MVKPLISNATATGASASMNVAGKEACVFQVAGTFSGTVQFEANNGLGWIAVQATNLNTGTAAATATAAGLYRLSALGLRAARVNVTVYTSGSISVTAFAE